MPAPWAVIFDVDGVLVDSFDAHCRSWIALAAETGARFSEAQFSATFGRTSREIIGQYWSTSESAAALSEAQVRRLDDRKEAIYRELVRERFPIMDGAMELIDELRQAGALLAVGSSGPPENVELALDRLGRRESFGAMVTGRDVTRGKPDPQVFQIAAQRLGVAPSSCVVIEDAPDGVRAARRAGMAAVALCSTSRKREDFVDADADRVVSHLRELSSSNLRDLAVQVRATRVN